MIHAPHLLADLTRQLKRLEDDLRARINEVPDLKASLQVEWQAACDADRCAEPFESWVEQVITQAGVHWLLSCVFLRFIEDNELVDRPWLSGTPASGRLALARDRHEAYFRAHPRETDRDYLLAAFREAGTLHGLQTFFDEAHNPVFRLGISGDAAMALRQFWQTVDPNTGVLAHDFTDPEWDTRFLGDLYQDLSEATRKRYALLQTPEFVEEFILDRTLTPAMREFGYQTARMIDPTCGSGHFLLGGFQRLVAEWQRREPGRNPRDIAQQALDAVAGVDLNPFAVAIARFRLLVAALKVCEVRRLADAPNLKMNVAIGDSLLHGQRFGLGGTSGIRSDELFDAAETHADTGLAHAYVSEDLREVQFILGRQYHAVVGNPPYIVVKDAALNQAYRHRYASCHMKYSLGCPFTERFFELAQTGRDGLAAGFVGLITTNSFMKREFGSKLIEQVLPRIDLTHVIDTSGAYIPGHGTPTVILYGRHRPPVGEGVRTVMGIKGEPSTPDDPAKGLVWSAILDQIDREGSESQFVSVADTSRATFRKHPWSIGGGGAAELLERTEAAAPKRLSSQVESIGFMAITGEDEAFLVPEHIARRIGAPARRFAVGDSVRDWVCGGESLVEFPYVASTSGFDPVPFVAGSMYDRWSWPNRTYLRSRVMFGKTAEQHGYRWDQYMQFIESRVSARRLITFGEVATHNHFVLDRGGKVFKQTAPVIKLPAEATDDDHLGQVGLLNSSVACFWFQQVCHNKGGPGGGSSKDEKWHDFYAFNSTKVAEFPLVEDRPVELARRIDQLAQAWQAQLPGRLIAAVATEANGINRALLDDAKDRAASFRRNMIALQEELDWHCYRLYGLLDDPLECGDPPEVAPGERAFEIVMARRLAAGALQTRWFEWLGIAPVVAIPARWPEHYRSLVQRRIDLIESDRNIGLVESFNCKRRWETTSWEDLEQAALRDWLLARLESPRYWPRGAEGDGGGEGGAGQPVQLSSINRVADAARLDADLMQIAELYAGRPDFDVTRLVGELVAAESMPFLPVLRYTESGLRKRAQWEDCWALQRREDAGEEVGKIPVPPKYQSKDFQKADFWRLRGGLDVPKERWVSYPGCERGADGSLPIAWAGWDHLQQATALATYYLDAKDLEGWPTDRLLPLLAGLLELLPWLKQWHNDLDPNFGEHMGDYYDGFVRDEARAHGVTLEQLREWRPAVTAARRGRRRSAS
ncbi:BREX-2 system adenine-specific DNA-methyltransferase PglX [Azoarcus sp. KH32C]|uniref:BREX-2 system adenine-specific DNA-methyltransferase PglX n=1 Tax=Azoarcus sp. KH32C TaxID=748247 RepID=UPI0002385FC6|nr:BREX-2 system adenine-specific DNA-methyltransferase PglX [Azoarcus sp. KH32C]BAL23489.1 hypothetical protein AZKH_1160 [Azoarcus sp. KH32C]